MFWTCWTNNYQHVGPACNLLDLSLGSGSAANIWAQEIQRYKNLAGPIKNSMRLLQNRVAKDDIFLCSALLKAVWYKLIMLVSLSGNEHNGCGVQQNGFSCLFYYLCTALSFMLCWALLSRGSKFFTYAAMMSIFFLIWSPIKIVLHTALIWCLFCLKLISLGFVLYLELPVNAVKCNYVCHPGDSEMA